MSTFITAADYDQAIKAGILARITDGGNHANLLDDAETKAISFMQGYLNARYDVDAIFSATGTDRHPIIVKFCVDIALYYLYSRLQAEQVPEFRKENHDHAEKWLRGVMKADINPPGLPKLPDGAKDYIAFGGRTPQNLFID